MYAYMVKRRNARWRDMSLVRMLYCQLILHAWAHVVCIEVFTQACLNR